MVQLFGEGKACLVGKRTSSRKKAEKAIRHSHFAVFQVMFHGSLVESLAELSGPLILLLLFVEEVTVNLL